MPLDPRAKRLLDMLGATAPASPAALSLTARRESFVSLMRFAAPSAPGAASGCQIQDRLLSGPAGALRVRLYGPPASPGLSTPALVYFHGGGLVAGSLDTHDPLCAALAHQARCRIISVEYRLAPEHKFPAAIADGVAAIRWVFGHAAELGLDPDRIGIGGDSAGGTLAAAICQISRTEPGVRLAFQLLLCPIMDFAADTLSRRQHGRGYLLDHSLLHRDLKDYLPDDVVAADPRVSPGRATDVAGLPPTAIHTAEFDPLLDEGREYAERLRNAGVRVQHTCHPGMIHLFFAMAAVIPYAHVAIEQIARDLAQGLAAVHRGGSLEASG